MFPEYNNYCCSSYEVQGPEHESTVNLFRSTVDSFLNDEAYKKFVINGFLAYKQIVDFDINNQKFKVVSSEGWSFGGEDFYEELEIKMLDGNRILERAILRTSYENGHKDKILSTEIGYQEMGPNEKDKYSRSGEVLRAFQLIQKINPQLIIKSPELVV